MESNHLLTLKEHPTKGHVSITTSNNTEHIVGESILLISLEMFHKPKHSPQQMQIYFKLFLLCFQSSQNPIATMMFIPIEASISVMSWYTLVVR
jgi:hypothetical protein